LSEEEQTRLSTCNEN